MTLDELLAVLQEGAESPAVPTAARLLIDRDDDGGATDAALLNFFLEPHEHPTATSMACRILAERDPNRDPS